MTYPQLTKQLDWFSTTGVDLFNLAVLADGHMLNHAHPRSRKETLSAAGWAWARNSGGCDVYLRPATGYSWPVVLLDDLPPAKAVAITNKYAAAAVETSRANCQVWIETSQQLDVASRKAVQTALAVSVGADFASVSGDHFGRAAGFRNQKPHRAHWLVDVITTSRGRKLDPSPYLPTAAPPSAGSRPSSPRGGCASFQTTSSRDWSGDDESSKEFGWARGWLDKGLNVEEGIRRLAARALLRGKRKTEAAAEIYARATFRAASPPRCPDAE